MIRGQAMGDQPFFETITLEKGVEYTGQVVTPGGKPAAEVPYQFENWSWGNSFEATSWTMYEGQTDADGRIRLRMPKSQALALYVMPPNPLGHDSRMRHTSTSGVAETGSSNPDVWVPTDLGRIVLARGVRLSGRLVDTEGKPIAGQTITGLSGEGPTTSTRPRPRPTAASPSGRSAPRTIVIYGQGQDGFGGVDPDAPPLSKPIRVFKPVKVYLEGGRHPRAVGVARDAHGSGRGPLRRFSGADPLLGSPAKVWGLIPNEQGQADPFGAHTTVGNGPASAINDPEPQDTSDRIDWAMQDRPDAEGRIVFLAPEGLHDATLKHLSIRRDDRIQDPARRERAAEVLGRRTDSDCIDRDRKITIVSYRAPTVFVTIKTDDGEKLENLEVNANFVFNGGGYGEGFTLQADGRYRSRSFMPDHEYKIIAAIQGLCPQDRAQAQASGRGLRRVDLDPPEAAETARGRQARAAVLGPDARWGLR